MLLHMLDKSPGLALATHICALLGAAVPFCFWYLTKVHFDDEVRLRPWHVALLVLLVATRYTG